VTSMCNMLVTTHRLLFDKLVRHWRRKAVASGPK
jgi:ribosomal protein L39E